MPSSQSEGTDLVSNLRLLAEEEAPLWEAAQAATTVTGGDVVRTGPFDPQTCSRVLLTWFGQGLIGLYEDSPPAMELTAEQTFLAFERYESWRPGETHLHLFVTPLGEGASEDAWNLLT